MYSNTMKYLFILFFLMVSTAKADQWLCTEAASQRSGDTIKSCGVGTGSDEAQARAQALDYAKHEFKSICEASSDCVNHYVTAQPMRTACSKEDGIYSCQRLVVFTIHGAVPEKILPGGFVASPNPESKITLTSCMKLNRDNSQEGIDAFSECEERYAHQ